MAAGDDYTPSLLAGDLLARASPALRALEKFAKTPDEREQLRGQIVRGVALINETAIASTSGDQDRTGAALQKLRELLAAIEDPAARAVAQAERSLLAALDGSCHTPIAGYARLAPGGRLRLDALVARADGSFLLRRGVECLQADAVRAGTDLGDSLRADSPADIFA